MFKTTSTNVNSALFYSHIVYFDEKFSLSHTSTKQKIPKKYQIYVP